MDLKMSVDIRVTIKSEQDLIFRAVKLGLYLLQFTGPS